jgi:hypothetical protein
VYSLSVGCVINLRSCLKEDYSILGYEAVSVYN